MDDESDFKLGEWIMVGYNNEKKIPVLVYSMKFKYLPIDKRLHLLQAWIDLIGREYDQLVDDPDGSE